MRFPKPKREAKTPKRIARRVHVKRVSTRHGRVVKADAVWSRKVKDRADGECQCRCGRKGQCAHHLWPKGAHPNLRYDVENGAWLTMTCHRRVHDVIGLETFRRWLLPADVYERLHAEAA